MQFVAESEREWLFTCPRCQQSRILTKPGFSKFIRERAQRGLL